jgi:TrmH family RNA methyltransferase
LETLSKNKIKWIKSLRLKKNRNASDVFVVEGQKMVEEVIKFYPEHIEFICTSGAVPKFDGLIYLTDEKTIKECTSLSTPSHHIAIVKKPTFKPNAAKFVLALDEIQDPGNLGTIIRTADWFGVDQIVCSKGTVDLFNPKVVQSTMGSIFRIPILYVDLVNYLKQTDLNIYGAMLEGENIYDLNLKKEAVIVIGNEGNGISKEVQAVVQESVHIPSFGKAESLNASVASAILLSEFRRRS